MRRVVRRDPRRFAFRPGKRIAGHSDPPEHEAYRRQHCKHRFQTTFAHVFCHNLYSSPELYIISHYYTRLMISQFVDYFNSFAEKNENFSYFFSQKPQLSFTRPFSDSFRRDGTFAQNGNDRLRFFRISAPISRFSPFFAKKNLLLPAFIRKKSPDFGFPPVSLFFCLWKPVKDRNTSGSFYSRRSRTT